MQTNVLLSLAQMEMSAQNGYAQQYFGFSIKMKFRILAKKLYKFRLSIDYTVVLNETLIPL